MTCASRFLLASRLGQLSNLAKARLNAYRRGPSLIFSIFFVAAAIVPSQAGDRIGYSSRSLSNAPMHSLAEPSQTWRQVAALFRLARSTTGSQTQSEIYCFSNRAGTACLRIKTSESSLNDVPVQHHLYADQESRALTTENARLRLFEQIAKLFAEVSRGSARQEKSDMEALPLQLRAKDYLPLTVRINLAENEIANNGYQPRLVSFRPDYNSNPTSQRTIAASDGLLELTELTVSRTSVRETMEEKVIRVSSNINSADDLWGHSVGSFSGTETQPVTNIPAPLEGSALLGGTFGNGNDYERRLRIFGQNIYIPPAPPKPSK